MIDQLGVFPRPSAALPLIWRMNRVHQFLGWVLNPDLPGPALHLLHRITPSISGVGFKLRPAHPRIHLVHEMRPSIPGVGFKLRPAQPGNSFRPFNEANHKWRGL